MVNVMNSPFCGGGLFLSPLAEIDDNGIDLIFASGINFPPVSLLLKARNEKDVTDDPRVTYLSGVKNASVTAINNSNLGNLLEIDGEVFRSKTPISKISYRITDSKIRFVC